MTPEHKAFFEYGELFQLWKDARRCVFWHEESHEDIRREIVQKVRQKRAVCRAWTILDDKKHCGNCHNEYVPCYLPPCNKCYRSPFVNNYEGFNDKWEPKKEGQ